MQLGLGFLTVLSMDRQALITALSGVALGAVGGYFLIRRDWWRATGSLALGAAALLNLITEGARSPGEDLAKFAATAGLMAIFIVALFVHQGRKQRMASLVLKMSVSLDGYVAPIGGSTDWIAAGGSDDGLSWTVETVSNASAHLIGAATYAAWAGYWPSASGPFARPMNDIPKVVFWDSLASANWGETTITSGDLAEAITRLKQERSGGYLLAHGGARFARSLVETGLIDEYRLLIHPTILGAGEGSSARRSPSSR
jgi:dihydrofolate reductase